ncbi:MAG: hypothetical protein R3F04_09095 [Lysobacteraceae bacterium]
MHLLAASHYAQIGDGASALRHAEAAWQPTSDVAAGSVSAVQLQLQTGDHIGAKRTIGDLESRVSAGDELAKAEIERLNDMLKGMHKAE